MNNTLLKTVQLKKTFFTGGCAVEAVKNLDLEIYNNEFTVIMGQSGSGKSTLLYLLSGLDKATKGHIQFLDQEIGQLNERKLARLRRKAFGFIFQSINLINHMNLWENILLAGFLGTVEVQKVKRRAEELLEIMNISSLKKRLPPQVSNGEQQRAAIARALINKPDILFADEPTGALNYATGQIILDYLSKINQERNQTIVMVTHDLKAACRGQRILFLRDGQLEGEFCFNKPDKKVSLENREVILFKWLSEKGW